MRTFSVFVAFLLIAIAPRFSQAEARVEPNVIYGMYSGSALLMDVHFPANPNGYGIVYIPGSGWHARPNFDARPLKEGVGSDNLWSNALLESGYTLFAINHRAAPGFRYPAAVEDAQRAVRFVRYHAADYGIDPERIGAVGTSSGGHLVSMLGALDGDQAPAGDGPINGQSSKVQTVVAFYPPTDFVAFAAGREGATHAVGSFLGTYLGGSTLRDPQSQEYQLYSSASPITHVTPEDPPFLLIHGDADETVPFTQSEIFEDKLKEVGVVVELIRVPGGGHGTRGITVPNAPDFIGSMVQWFDNHLRE